MAAAPVRLLSFPTLFSVANTQPVTNAQQCPLVGLTSRRSSKQRKGGYKVVSPVAREEYEGVIRKSSNASRLVRNLYPSPQSTPPSSKRPLFWRLRKPLYQERDESSRLVTISTSQPQVFNYKKESFTLRTVLKVNNLGSPNRVSAIFSPIINSPSPSLIACVTSDPENEEALTHEAEILNELGDLPGVIKELDHIYSHSSGKTGIFMPWYNRSFKDLCSEKSDLTLFSLKQIVYSLCLTVFEMHQRHIVHNDIKPDNILLAESPLFYPKPIMVDFGNAVHVDPITHRVLAQDEPYLVRS